MHLSRPGQPRGFTLVELMVVIALVAILAAMSLVGISKMTSQGKRSTITEGVVNVLDEARELALSHASQVVVIVDTDLTDHGGVFLILDPTHDFSPSNTSSWVRTYATPADPVSVNNTVFSSAKATLRDEYRFTNPDVKPHISMPSASQIGTFATGAATTLAASPFTPPSSSPVSNHTSGTGCSFCSSAGWGYVLVTPDGKVRLSNPNDLTQLQTLGSQGYVMLADPNVPTVGRAAFISTPTGIVYPVTAN